MNDTTTAYTTGMVTSADGATIGYRQVGSGPGLILLHAGMHASQHYMRLAAALADTFTVYVPDRRGRGLSGPPGAQYSMARECEDVEALLTTTSSHFLFGHSSGGLIALQAALTLPAVRKVAVYEPPLSVQGSVPVSWVSRYEREVARGERAAALLTALKGLRVSRPTTVLPRWLLLPFIMWTLRREKQTRNPNDVSLEALIPTQRLDMRLVNEMDGRLARFTAMRAEVLLLGGKKSQMYLRKALDALQATLPQVKRITYPDLHHRGPNETAPERIAKDLRAFLRQG